MKRLVLIVAAIILVLAVGALVGWNRLAAYLAEPGAPGSPEKVVVLGAPVTPASLVEVLATEGLVARPAWLAAYFEHFAKDADLAAGEYALSASMAPIEILERIRSGKVVTHAVKIDAGSTLADILARLAEQGLAPADELRELASSPKLVAELGLAGESLEGYLFPDTYELPRGLGARRLLETLVAHYRKVVHAGVLDVARARGVTEHELVTLASLVERSGVLANEQRVYAALLHNRLAAGLPLESAASLAYGITKLSLPTPDVGAAPETIDHPWNTYARVGLPPSPIASPSLAAIMAAAEPAESQALYVVKRADGAHVFCADLDCYAAALKAWSPSDADALLKRQKRRR